MQKDQTLNGQDLKEHIPVLLKETIENLNLKGSDTVIDCTTGLGGHGLEICKLLDKDGIYLGIDQDQETLKQAKEKITNNTKAKTIFIQDNFRNLEKIVEDNGVKKVNKILLDLGWNSSQLNLKKGFSFNDEESLHMTYGDPKEYKFTGYEVVNNWNEKNIADILYYYGGEFFSRRIARAIIKNRPIYNSKILANIVTKAVPIKGKIHPATKTFQAIRIVVNDEIRALEKALISAEKILDWKEGNRLAIISFHSGEDRIVKKYFKDLAKKSNWSLVNKKIIKPGKEEISNNKRARSAKLRIIEINKYHEDVYKNK